MDRVSPQLVGRDEVDEAAVVESLDAGDWVPAHEWIQRVEQHATAIAEQQGRELPRVMAIGASSRMSRQLLRYLEPSSRRADDRAPLEMVRAVEQLAPKQRAVLVGVYLDGKLQRQIAEEQGISEPAVSKVKRKAEARLEQRCGPKVWEILPHGDRRRERDVA